MIFTWQASVYNVNTKIDGKNPGEIRNVFTINSESIANKITPKQKKIEREI